jgi:HAD superfamily hydrolase (TIGR01509 family)
MRAVLFDLDGTLLPIDFEPFFMDYFARVCRFYGGATGLDLQFVFKEAVEHMLRNDGSQSNAEVFWRVVEHRTGRQRRELEAVYGLFIEREGELMGQRVVPDPAAARAVNACREHGATLVLATNPVFPRAFLDLRLRWAALDPNAFDLITCYETTGFCKPRPEYYREIAERLRVDANDCLMVGNDVDMDLRPAAHAGMRTCLVTGPHTIRGAAPFVPDHECALGQVGALTAASSRRHRE